MDSDSQGEMTYELPGTNEHGAWRDLVLHHYLVLSASASGKASGKHASGAGALDISLSPPCAPPHVGRGNAGDTEVDVLWATQLGREARLRVEEDKRQHLRKA